MLEDRNDKLIERVTDAVGLLTIIARRLEPLVADLATRTKGLETRMGANDARDARTESAFGTLATHVAQLAKNVEALGRAGTRTQAGAEVRAAARRQLQSEIDAEKGA